VISKETMQNDYFHHHLPAHTTSIDRSHSEDEKYSFTNPTTNIDAAEVEEKERTADEKHFQMEVDDDDDDKPLIQVAMTDDSSNFSFYDESPYRESQPPQAHTDSHDSLLQPDHHIMDTINTTASSTDDLSTTHQLSSSVFHSKDSALGLSDDNLNVPSKNPFTIMDDDDDDDDDHNDDDDDDDLHHHHHHHQQQQQEIVSSSLLPTEDIQSKFRFVYFFSTSKLNKLIEYEERMSIPHFRILMMQYV
jgi:hypothetical protein